MPICAFRLHIAGYFQVARKNIFNAIETLAGSSGYRVISGNSLKEDEKMVGDVGIEPTTR